MCARLVHTWFSLLSWGGVPHEIKLHSGISKITLDEKIKEIRSRFRQCVIDGQKDIDIEARVSK